MKNNIWKSNLHIEPENGWLNDPNGLVYFKGNYYIFHQYSYEVNGGMKYWFGYVSKDLIEYKSQGIKVSPDILEDSSGVYSGSANIENDELVFYYTGNVKHKGNYDYVHEGRGHNTIIFKSKDGINFTPKEILLTNKDYPNMSNHVRDPKVFEKDGNKYLVLGARDSKDYGCLLIYKNNEYYKTIYSDMNLGFMWECPDYFKLNDKEIFIFSPQGVSRMYPDYKNMYQVGYSVINEEIENLEKINNFNLIDYGHDYYAPQTFIDEDGNRVLIAWMYVPDSSYTNPTTIYGYQNCLSIPRVLEYKDNKLVQSIHKSVKNLLNDEIKDNKFNEASWYYNQENSNDFNIKIDTFNIEYNSGNLSVKFGKTGYGRDDRKYNIDLKNIEIVFDSSSVEIFINNGQFCISSRFYPENHNVEIISEDYIAYKLGAIKIEK